MEGQGKAVKGSGMPWKGQGNSVKKAGKKAKEGRGKAVERQWKVEGGQWKGTSSVTPTRWISSSISVSLFPRRLSVFSPEQTPRNPL